MNAAAAFRIREDFEKRAIKKGSLSTSFLDMAPTRGFEPPTPRLGVLALNMFDAVL